jgi:hypothetical protein
LNLIYGDLFICEIKPRFVICKNMNLDVNCETRFGALKSTFDLISKCLGLIQ